MPARRLDHGPVVVHMHDVVGMDVDDLPGFIGHVGLAAEDHPRLAMMDGLRITDMQPPLVRAGGPDQIHAHGTVPLTAVEAGAIQEFIDRMENEYLLTNREGVHQYVVRPHCVLVSDQDATITARRLSCSGFVLEAYRFVDIDLIDTGETSLPAVGLDLLRRTYADEQQLRVLETPRLRNRFLGLAGDGSWPIVLPGYLLHSLARTEPEIRAGPYRPRPGDEFFPTASASG